MTPDELRARVERFVVEECKGRWPAVSLIESLCREMIAEGRVQMIDDVGDLWDNGDPNNHEFVGWCRKEAQRVKDNHDTKKS